MKSAVLALATAAALFAGSHAATAAGMFSPGKAAPHVTSTGSADAGLVHQVRGRRGVATGLAIGLGVLGVVAASRAYGERRYYEERYVESHGMRCRRWFRECNRGSDRACWRFEHRC